MRLKHDLSDLALFGGEMAFPEPLHVGRPNFGDPGAFHRRFEQIVATRRFTNDGPFVRELEDEVARLTGAPNAVAVCNATTGLQLLARALELRGEVVVPSFTFIATAHAFAWMGLTPVFADIRASDHGVDPASVDRAATSACSAIVGVHTWGVECDVEALEAIAARRGVPLILDAAHALGCDGIRGGIGSSGTAEVFSLHATKVANSFEGGIITTRDDALASRLRLLRDFGFSGYDRVVAIGTNAKLSELHAIAGLTTLECLPQTIAHNRRCYDGYRSLLGGARGLRFVDVAARGRSSYQYVVVEVDASLAGVTRDALARVLGAEGVWARRYFHPGCHRAAPYADASRGASLAVTEAVAERVLVLPTGPSVSDEAVETVASIVRVALDRPDAVRAAVIE